MNGPDNLWEWMGVVGSAASVAGFGYALWADRRWRTERARADALERRAAERERAAVTDARRVWLLRDAADAAAAAKRSLAERRSGPAWEAHCQWLRAAGTRVAASSALTADERALARGVTLLFPSLAYRDDESERALLTIAARLDTLHAGLSDSLTRPDA